MNIKLFLKHSRRSIRPLFILPTLCCSLLVPQLAYPQSASKTTGQSFSDSPVDAIVARVKQDLQTLKSVTTKPGAPTDMPESKPDASSKPGTPKDAAMPSTPINSAKVRALEANAQKCQTAEEAAVLYRIFMVAPETTEDEREQAGARLEYWEQAAADQLVRVGPKWMPKVDADALLKEADDLVREANELLNVDNFAAANSKLEKAAKVYPDHLESVFLLALGALINRDYKAAEVKFNQCLSRAPDNAALLNNVGYCELQMKRYPLAVKHWLHAAEVDLENEKVAQNLGQFISDVNLKRLPMTDKRALADATEAYQKMIAKDPGNRANPSKGYVMSRLLRSRPGDSTGETSRAVGNGAGFVIAEHFILTNRHVVEDADSLVIQDPMKPNGLPLAASVVAKSKDLDLAIVECRQLNAPAAPLNATPVGRGTEVMALGYPIASIVGNGLKATRGIITGLPSEATEKMLILDVQVNPGNSGGPLCDRSGRVVGVVAAKTFNAAFVQSYGLAIPIADALPFINQTIKDYSPPKAENRSLEWTDVDAAISPSTVMIVIQKKR